MVDPKVLEKHKCTPDRLREIFTATTPEKLGEDADEKEKDSHSNKCKDAEIRKKWEERIWTRIQNGLENNCANARPYQAVDMAMDAAPIVKESVPLLLWAQGKINIEKVGSCLTRDLGAEQAKKFFTKTVEGGQEAVKLNIPRITETPINIVRSYVTRRLAAMDALWSNLWPQFKYDPRGKDPVTQLRADALTQRVDIMADAYGYRRLGSQWRRDMLKYSKSVVFPRASWDRQVGWRFKKTNTTEPSEETESFVEREGVDFVNPHPTRVYYDLNSPLGGINTDTGPTWIGYWDIVRYGTLTDNKGLPYYNLDQLFVTDGVETLMNKYGDFFGYYFDPCVIKSWPPLSSDPSAKNSRSGNIGRYSTAPSSGKKDEDRDYAVTVTQHFERINPKAEGFGDYDADVWVRFVVGGSGTIMFAEYMPSLPAIYGGINVDDNRQENLSMAMELLSYQDQLSNINTSMIEQLRTSFIQLWLLNEDILKEETIKSFESSAKNREWWMEPKLLKVSYSKLMELIGPTGNPQEAFKIVTANIGDVVQKSLTAMGHLLNMCDRLMILSPNELGQPNPREVSARESQEISTSVQSIYSFINQGPREQYAAMKELLYESLVCCGTELFTVPVIRRYTKSTIEAAGFRVSSTTDVGADNRVPLNAPITGSLKDLRYDYYYDSRDGAERVANSQTAQALTQLAQVLLQIPGIPEGLGKARVFEIANSIIRASGAPTDLQLEVEEGEDPSIAPPEQPAPPAPPQPPPQDGGMVELLRQQDQRIQRLEQMLQESMGAAVQPVTPQVPPQAANAESRLMLAG